MAERRVALVIGNGNYKNLQKLPNPTRDSDAMANALRNLGFEVLAGNDLDREGMVNIITRFDSLATDASAAVIFYAGHAVQVNGENYLLPVSTIDADQQRQVTLGSVRLSEIYEDVANKVDTTILLVDACRNDPFTRGLRGTGNTSRGLAVVKKANSPNGSFIGFATEPGDVAQDGSGLNSPYTTAILEHIDTPDVDIHVIMARVGDRVRELTQNQQIPWVNTSLTSKGFKFKPVAVALPQPQTQTPVQPTDQCASPIVENALWETAVRENSVAGYERYLSICSNNLRSSEARKRLDEIRNQPKWYLALYDGVDFWGKDIEKSGLEMETVEACAATCASNTACKVFTFIPEKKICYLKTGIDLPILQPGILSGVFVERENTSTDVPEGPTIETRFSAFPSQAHAGPINQNWQSRGVENIDACLRACDREDSCRYVTYGERQSDGSRCAHRFVGVFGDIFGKKDKRGATAFDKVTNYVEPSSPPIPLPGVVLSQN